MKSGERPLTNLDRLDIFRIATASLVHWHCEQLRSGMSDAELETALTDVLGIFGGRAGPGKPFVSFAGADLCI